MITTVAGNGVIGFSGDGGMATNARIAPHGVVLDSSGMYFGEQLNHRVRKVTPSGVITTFAGNGELLSAGDGGPATAAALQNPTALAIDVAGSIYIAEDARIRKVTTNGIITTVAGNGTQGFGGDGLSTLPATSIYRTAITLVSGKSRALRLLQFRCTWVALLRLRREAAGKRR